MQPPLHAQLLDETHSPLTPTTTGPAMPVDEDWSPWEGAAAPNERGQMCAVTPVLATYAATPVRLEPPSEELYRRTREALKSSTYDSWDNWDEFDPRGIGAASTPSAPVSRKRSAVRTQKMGGCCCRSLFSRVACLCATCVAGLLIVYLRCARRSLRHA